MYQIGVHDRYGHKKTFQRWHLVIIICIADLKQNNGALNRGSYMSAHVLLNLINELRKRDKMRGLPSILSLFRNEFNKFNNSRARILFII